MEEAPISSKLKGLKVVLCTSGSRGEVQPFIALGQRLKKLGNEVVVAVEERLRSFVENSGLTFFPVAGDPTGVLNTSEGQQWLAEGKIMTIMKKMQDETNPYFEQTLNDYLNACDGANLIIASPLVMTKTLSIAEKKKIPWIPVIWGPSWPTREFPVWAITDKILPGFLNMFTYSVLFKMLWWQEKSKINGWRQKVLQLPPTQPLMDILSKNKVDVLCACDKFMIPGTKRPQDWPENVHVTGHWFVQDTPEEAVNPKLVEFLKEGEAPIYLGFGSMPAPEPQKLLNLAVAIVNHLKRRVILVAGWTDLKMDEDVSKEILIIAQVSHDWLLPKCCAIVHHCGIGTCYSVLRSGVPSLPIPVYLDQPHNANVLFHLGVAGNPIPFQSLNEAKLCQALEKLLASAPIKVKAREVAEELRANGVESAVSIIEGIMEKHATSSKV